MFLVIDRSTNNFRILKELFNKYKVTILKSIDKFVTEENIKGYSFRQYTIYNYYLAFYYAFLIKEIADRSTKTISEIIEDLDLDIDCVDKALNCEGISIEEIFKNFGIDITLNDTSQGIESEGIQSTFSIEGDNLTPNTPINISNLISKIGTKECTYLLSNQCS